MNFSGQPCEFWRRGKSYASESARRATRIPTGHPKGYLDAFANVDAEIFRAVRAEVSGPPVPTDRDSPSIGDGLVGTRFIDAVVGSSRQGAR